MERVLLYEDALAEVLRVAEAARLARFGEGMTAGVERLPLLTAHGRVLAEAIRAERDQPPFARSTRDGFAVRVTDQARENGLQVVGLVRAGER